MVFKITLFLTLWTAAGFGFSPPDNLVMIQGRYVGSELPLTTSPAEAADRALNALVGAYAPDGSLKSENLDPDGRVRSFTWDATIGVAFLGIRGRPEVKRAVQALIARQRRDGSLPALVYIGSTESDSSGATETAAFVAVVGGLANRRIVDPESVKPALRAALAWMETNWMKETAGAFAIAPGSSQASTEATAVALMANIEADKLFPGCCKNRALAAARFLTGMQWRTDHFARGLNDADETGPDTHDSLAVLALTEAARAYPGETPDPKSYDPLPWMMSRFLRTANLGGRQINGLGDRLILSDSSGLLYGCDGGTFAQNSIDVLLNCPTGSVRRADPNPHGGGCYSPYAGCASRVDSIPAGAVPVQSVNAEITLLGAMAAMALGRSADAALLLNGALAMQRPSGEIIAIAGPASLVPGRALLYPINYRRIQFGYTALLGLALDRINPFAFSSGQPLAPSLPAGLSVPESAIATSMDLTALLPDPAAGFIDAIASDEVLIRHPADPQGWGAAQTDIFEHAGRPMACLVFNGVVSGYGWPGFELKAIDAAQRTTHGRRYPNLLGGDPVRLSVPLSTIGLFWTREADAGDDPPKLHQIAFVQDDVAPKKTLDVEVGLHLANLQLAEGDCMEGAPPQYRRDRVSLNGDRESNPLISDGEYNGEPALRVEFALNSMVRWQTILAQDRWRWGCVNALELRYASENPVRVQLKFEDAQVRAGLDTGARLFAETTLGPTRGWGSWRVSVSDLHLFEPADARAFNWNKLRKVEIAIIPGEGAANNGVFYLDRLDPLARQDSLMPDGTCREP